MLIRLIMTTTKVLSKVWVNGCLILEGMLYNASR